jgi:hypothetical protein
VLLPVPNRGSSDGAGCRLRVIIASAPGAARVPLLVPRRGSSDGAACRLSGLRRFRGDRRFGTASRAEGCCRCRTVDHRTGRSAYLPGDHRLGTRGRPVCRCWARGIDHRMAPLRVPGRRDAWLPGWSSARYREPRSVLLPVPNRGAWAGLGAGFRVIVGSAPGAGSCAAAGPEELITGRRRVPGVGGVRVCGVIVGSVRRAARCAAAGPEPWIIGRPGCRLPADRRFGAEDRVRCRCVSPTTDHEPPRRRVIRSDLRHVVPPADRRKGSPGAPWARPAGRIPPWPPGPLGPRSALRDAARGTVRPLVAAARRACGPNRFSSRAPLPPLGAALCPPPGAAVAGHNAPGRARKRERDQVLAVQGR